GGLGSAAVERGAARAPPPVADGEDPAGVPERAAQPRHAGAAARVHSRPVVSEAALATLRGTSPRGGRGPLVPAARLGADPLRAGTAREPAHVQRPDSRGGCPARPALAEPAAGRCRTVTGVRGILALRRLGEGAGHCLPSVHLPRPALAGTQRG